MKTPRWWGGNATPPHGEHRKGLTPEEMQARRQERDRYFTDDQRRQSGAHRNPERDPDARLLEGTGKAVKAAGQAAVEMDRPKLGVPMKVAGQGLQRAGKYVQNRAYDRVHKTRQQRQEVSERQAQRERFIADYKERRRGLEDGRGR